MTAVENSKNVLLIFDSNLTHQAKILMIGLRENLTGSLFIYCIVSKDVFLTQLESLHNFGNKLGVNLTIAVENKEMFNDETGAVSEIIYQKFLFPNFFPHVHGKLLYLDIDVVPIQNFDELFSLEFTEPFAATAHDDIVTRRKLKNWKLIANGGVQLFNTDVYKEDHLMQRSIDFYQSKQNKLKLSDEIVLNLLSKKKWFDFGVDYNMPYTKTWYILHPKRRRNVKLVHFIGIRKPWRKHFTSPLAKRYLRSYRDRETIQNFK